MSSPLPEEPIEPVYPRPPDTELSKACRYCQGTDMATKFDLCKGSSDIRNYGRWMQQVCIISPSNLTNTMIYFTFQCKQCYKYQFHSDIKHPEEKIPESLRVKHALVTSAKQANAPILCAEPGCRVASKNTPRAANRLCGRERPLCAEHCYLRGGCRGIHKDPKRGYQPNSQAAISTPASQHEVDQPSAPKAKPKPVKIRQLYGRSLDEGYRYRDPQVEQEAIRKRATLEARVLHAESMVISLYFYYMVCFISF